MVGERRLLTELSRLIKRTRADGASVCAHAKVRRVFRFAHEAIHQDLTQESVTVTIKVIRDHRIGVASADTLEPSSLARSLKAALEIAQHTPQHSPLAELPRSHRIRSTQDYHSATARASAHRSVTSIKRLVHLTKGLGVELAGSLVSGEDEFAVANSNGVRCYAASTIAGAKLVTMYRKLSGYASAVHRDLGQLNLEELLKRSLRQSHHRQDPITPPLGSYEVILEPEAVGELVTWLGYIAFGAKSLEERTSFLAGRFGERVMSRAMTIYDDGTEATSFGMPFDFEGTPKRRVTLIDRGQAAGVVYDTTYGQRFDHPSTGHGMPPDSVEGPFPLHLAMTPGRTTIANMIRSCRRGLLIPRFHYVNGLLNPREALMTGLTREGAFLIEDGKLSAPVTRLRFTQSLLEAFSHVRGVSRHRELIADPSQELGCALMPALHLGTFMFTGHSEST